MHKYTRVTRGQEGVEIKSMIDLVLVKRNMLRHVQDVRAMRMMGRNLSDTMLYCVKSGWWEHGLRGERGWLRIRGLEARN